MANRLGGLARMMMLSTAKNRMMMLSTAKNSTRKEGFRRMFSSEADNNHKDIFGRVDTYSDTRITKALFTSSAICRSITNLQGYTFGWFFNPFQKVDTTQKRLENEARGLRNELDELIKSIDESSNEVDEYLKTLDEFSNLVDEFLRIAVLSQVDEYVKKAYGFRNQVDEYVKRADGLRNRVDELVKNADELSNRLDEVLKIVTTK